jgi:hypothetical protein
MEVNWSVEIVVETFKSGIEAMESKLPGTGASDQHVWGILFVRLIIDTSHLTEVTRKSKYAVLVMDHM